MLRRGHCFANDTLDNDSEESRSIRVLAISTTARGQAASKVNVIAGYFLLITLCISYEADIYVGIMFGMLMRLSVFWLRLLSSRRYDLSYRYFEIGCTPPPPLSATR